jgi:hypothetical protein
VRKVLIAVSVLFLAAGCGSSAKSAAAPTATAPASSTTVDPNLVPNDIPYVVGAPTGLPNGWIVTVTKVHRPYSQSGLPSAGPGQQYVAVDINMEYEGGKPATVDASTLFKMVDGNRELHEPVKSANGIDGVYKPGTKHSGRLVFVVPPKVRLALAMDGPKIGTQRSVFTIDPPTVPSD